MQFTVFIKNLKIAKKESKCFWNYFTMMMTVVVDGGDVGSKWFHDDDGVRIDFTNDVFPLDKREIRRTFM